MDQTLFLLCKFGDATFVFKAYQNSTFNELMSFLCGRWKSLAQEFCVTYSLPGHSKCIIENNADFQTLMELAKAISLDRVDVGITKEGSQSGGDSGSCSENSMALVKYSGKKSIQPIEPTISNFCHHAKRSYLSDDWVHEIHSVNQAFPGGAIEFRQALCKFASQVGFHFIYLKNTIERVTAACKMKDNGCLWHVHATIELSNGFFYIKKLNNEHTCGAVFRTKKHSRLSSELIGSLIQEEIRLDPKKRPIDILYKIKGSYGFDISYSKSWRGIENARNEIFGSHSTSFDQLRWYLDKLEEVNPDSHFIIDVDDKTGQFKKCFVAFGARCYGFNFCRPLLFLDGTFLKSRYKGTLLAATGKDGDNGLYNVAFAVVDSEDTNNWLWFLQELTHILNPDRTITFVSDRHHGLLEAVRRTFPTAHHSYCLNHLKENLKVKLGGISKEVKKNIVYKFGELALSPDEQTYQTKLNELLVEGGTNLKKFLESVPVDRFVNAYFKGKRYGEMTSNAAESFNNMIIGARSLPITQLVDNIRVDHIEKMSRKRDESSKWHTTFCPRVEDILRDEIEASRSWYVSSSNEFVYEVLSHPSVIVDIKNRTCTCGKWQYNGLPCEHAVIVFYNTGKELADFVEPYFHASYYRESYSRAIHPVPTFGKPAFDSANTIILPPVTKKQAGRPKKKRIPSRGEKVKMIRCSRCNQFGNHNRKSCTAPI